MMVASFALAMTASNIAHRERAQRPLVATGAIVWGGRIFPTQAELAGWLRSRGADYSTWAIRHRAAAHAQRNPLAFGAPPDTSRTDAADVSAAGAFARFASLTWYVLAISTSAAAGLIVAELLR